MDIFIYIIMHEQAEYRKSKEEQTQLVVRIKGSTMRVRVLCGATIIYMTTCNAAE